MTGHSKWPPKPRKRAKLVHPLQKAPDPRNPGRPCPEPKYPKKVHNPIAATLTDPAFRPQKTKSPKLYNRKIKHKKKI